MTKRFLTAFIFVFLFPPLAQAANEVSLINVSSGTIQDAAKMLAGEGKWSADQNAQFVKLDLRFASPPQFDRIEVQSCEGPFSDGAHVYVNFDDSSLFSEGGKPALGFSFSKPISNARSVAFNFRFNQSVCVSSIRFIKDGKPIKLTVPFIQEQVSGSVLPLHDGRLDTNWSLSATDKAAELRFESEKKIERVRVWNGDQRSSGLFRASPRVKSLALFTDTQREVVSLKNTTDAQTVELANSIKGKVIRLLVEEAYDGALSAAKISEVQVGNDDEFFVTDISSLMNEKTASLRTGFSTAKLERILDRTLTTSDEGTKWSVRVRSDGTFFMRGYTENLQRSRNFSYLGQYRIKKADKKGVLLAVSGFVSSLPFELDGSNCGRDCGGNPGPEPTFIEDEISIGAGKNGIIFVRDEGPRRAKGLEFYNLKMRIAKEGE